MYLPTLLICLVVFSGCASIQSEPDPVLRDINWMWNTTIEHKDEPDQEDHWQPPAVTLELGTADCEDLAIAKQFDLAGEFPLTELRLLFVYTEKGEPHVVLGYGTGPEFVILDNRHSQLITLQQGKYSSPVYQIDATGTVYTGDGIPTSGRAGKFDKLLPTYFIGGHL